MQRFIPDDLAARLITPAAPDPSAPLSAKDVLGVVALEFARQKDHRAALERDIRDLHAKGQADAEFIEGVSLNVAP